MNDAVVVINDPSNWELALRLLAAVLMGAAIGLQRELYRKPAGVRTHALICLGAALFTVASVEGFGGPAYVDSSRVAAGVVTGIGFLGAGAILRGDKGRVAGLTTAASIWVIAAVGIAVGAGMFFISTAATILAALILLIPKINDPEKYVRVQRHRRRLEIKATQEQNPEKVEE